MFTPLLLFAAPENTRLALAVTGENRRIFASNQVRLPDFWAARPGG
jgi:hypothetical protein